MENKTRISKTPLFLEFSILAFLVATINSFALAYDLYWSVYELDSLTHFLGGALVATFFIWIYFYSGFFRPTDRKLWSFVKIALIGSVFIAVTWEIYELLLGEAAIQKAEYPYDTTLDFIMDTLGILAAIFYGYLKELNFNKILIDVESN